MKLRSDKGRISDEEEEALESVVRSLAERAGAPSPPPRAYWQNLPLRMNKGVDEATSGMAISLSWAARVAIPGVVAVLSFLIGLRYYAPDADTGPASVVELAQSLPATTVDSLYVASIGSADSAAVARFADRVLSLPADVTRDYVVEQAAMQTLLEGLSEQELRAVIARLGTTTNL